MKKREQSDNYFVLEKTSWFRVRARPRVPGTQETPAHLKTCEICGRQLVRRRRAPGKYGIVYVCPKKKSWNKHTVIANYE